MTAKPIIDILIIVDRPVFLQVKDRLATLGYVHQGDLGITDREAFNLTDQAAKGALPYHHLYVAIEGTAAPREQISFRNFLRAHPEWVERLSLHKVQLCERYDNDRQSYIDGKSAMVREITQLALERAVLP